MSHLTKDLYLDERIEYADEVDGSVIVRAKSPIPANTAIHLEHCYITNTIKLLYGCLLDKDIYASVGPHKDHEWSNEWSKREPSRVLKDYIEERIAETQLISDSDEVNYTTSTRSFVRVSKGANCRPISLDFQLAESSNDLKVHFTGVVTLRAIAPGETMLLSLSEGAGVPPINNGKVQGLVYEYMRTDDAINVIMHQILAEFGAFVVDGQLLIHRDRAISEAGVPKFIYDYFKSKGQIEELFKITTEDLLGRRIRSIVSSVLILINAAEINRAIERAKTLPIVPAFTLEAEEEESKCPIQ